MYFKLQTSFFSTEPDKVIENILIYFCSVVCCAATKKYTPNRRNIESKYQNSHLHHISNPSFSKFYFFKNHLSKIVTIVNNCLDFCLLLFLEIQMSFFSCNVPTCCLIRHARWIYSRDRSFFSWRETHTDQKVGSVQYTANSSLC